MVPRKTETVDPVTLAHSVPRLPGFCSSTAAQGDATTARSFLRPARAPPGDLERTRIRFTSPAAARFYKRRSHASLVPRRKPIRQLLVPLLGRLALRPNGSALRLWGLLEVRLTHRISPTGIHSAAQEVRTVYVNRSPWETRRKHECPETVDPVTLAHSVPRLPGFCSSTAAQGDATTARSYRLLWRPSISHPDARSAAKELARRRNEAGEPQEAVDELTYLDGRPAEQTISLVRNEQQPHDIRALASCRRPQAGSAGP
jgi:hypothetical protein